MKIKDRNEKFPELKTNKQTSINENKNYLRQQGQPQRTVNVSLIQHKCNKEILRKYFSTKNAKLNQKPQSIWQGKISAAIKGKKSCFTFQQ